VADFQSLIRRNDVLGRLGGEKFAVLPTGHIVRSRVRCRGTAARPGGRGVP
jgi:GGDEF domain-containing protein